MTRGAVMRSAIGSCITMDCHYGLLGPVISQCHRSMNWSISVLHDDILLLFVSHDMLPVVFA